MLCVAPGYVPHIANVSNNVSNMMREAHGDGQHDLVFRACDLPNTNK